MTVAQVEDSEQQRHVRLWHQVGVSVPEATLTSSRLCSNHLCLLSSCRLREQLADLYQAIHSSANRTLLQQYEEVVRSLFNHVGENRKQCEQLETSLIRWGRSSLPLARKLS